MYFYFCLTAFHLLYLAPTALAILLDIFILKSNVIWMSYITYFKSITVDFLSKIYLLILEIFAAYYFLNKGTSYTFFSIKKKT